VPLELSGGLVVMACRNGLLILREMKRKTGWVVAVGD
jgi:hypothetical protein